MIVLVERHAFDLMEWTLAMKQSAARSRMWPPRLSAKCGLGQRCPVLLQRCPQQAKSASLLTPVATCFMGAAFTTSAIKVSDLRAFPAVSTRHGKETNSADRWVDPSSRRRYFFS